jgi:hypothetical protein
MREDQQVQLRLEAMRLAIALPMTQAATFTEFAQRVKLIYNYILNGDSTPV